MKFSVVRERFFSLLQKASPFISTKLNEISVLRCALLEIEEKRIVVKTTNIHEYFTGECGGKVEKVGSVLVDFKTFFEVIKAISDTKISVEKKENSLVITSESGTVRIPTLESGEFPTPPKINKDSRIDKSYFSSKNTEQIAFSCATDETRPILTGMCFNFLESDVNIVGTDGFRLSLFSVKKKDSEKNLDGAKIIIPARSMVSIQKIFQNDLQDVYYSPLEKSLNFVNEEISLVVRLLDGEFPPYEK